MATDTALKSGNPAIAQVMEWKEKGLKIGFANGCFDILHAGHVNLLNMARNNCDKLVVGVSSDAIVRKNKGETRPALNEEERAFILSALAAVDMVIIIFDDTPLRVLETLKPDIIAKGKDYENKDFPEKSFLESYGAKIIYAPLMNSSSTIISRLRKDVAQ